MAQARDNRHICGVRPDDTVLFRTVDCKMFAVRGTKLHLRHGVPGAVHRSQRPGAAQSLRRAGDYLAVGSARFAIDTDDAYFGERRLSACGLPSVGQGTEVQPYDRGGWWSAWGGRCVRNDHPAASE